jgi:hypothetical protein
MEDWLLFANLVDFDSVWGHRNDVEGFAGGLAAVDAGAAGLGAVLARAMPDVVRRSRRGSHDEHRSFSQYSPLLSLGRGRALRRRPGGRGRQRSHGSPGSAAAGSVIVTPGGAYRPVAAVASCRPVACRRRSRGRGAPRADMDAPVRPRWAAAAGGDGGSRHRRGGGAPAAPGLRPPASHEGWSDASWRGRSTWPRRGCGACAHELLRRAAHDVGRADRRVWVVDLQRLRRAAGAAFRLRRGRAAAVAAAVGAVAARATDATSGARSSRRRPRWVAGQLRRRGGMPRRRSCRACLAAGCHLCRWWSTGPPLWLHEDVLAVGRCCGLLAAGCPAVLARWPGSRGRRGPRGLRDDDRPKRDGRTDAGARAFIAASSAAVPPIRPALFSWLVMRSLTTPRRRLGAFHGGKR